MCFIFSTNFMTDPITRFFPIKIKGIRCFIHAFEIDHNDLASYMSSILELIS